ncbi:hypothetical protein DPMN_136559 [Dreissena polymorpha]|uniref:Uncharacterized protein n=1 Tax=Dreissena polymorpha TaxID=45954 RepID=A0A9D4JCS1_DREPO|nr:hypothetical protein DPMN_136559 [Dreissena polymorpha]
MSHIALLYNGQGNSRYSGWSDDTLSACDTLRYFIVDEVTRGWSDDTLSACDTLRYFIVDEVTRGWSGDTLSACDTLRYFITDKVTRGTQAGPETHCACDTLRYFIVNELTPAFGAITLQRDCACYGSDVNIDSIKANCTDAGGRIYVERVIRAAKATNLNCPNPATEKKALANSVDPGETPYDAASHLALDRDEAKCCSYDEVNDCILDLSSADVPGVYRDCTGSHVDADDKSLRE